MHIPRELIVSKIWTPREEEDNEPQDGWKELKSPHNKENGDIKLNKSYHKSIGI